MIKQRRNFDLTMMVLKLVAVAGVACGVMMISAIGWVVWMRTGNAYKAASVSVWVISLLWTMLSTKRNEIFRVILISTLYCAFPLFAWLMGASTKGIVGVALIPLPLFVWALLFCDY